MIPALIAWLAELRTRSRHLRSFHDRRTVRLAGRAKACPQALRVLDTSDLHCLRAARQAQLKHGGGLDLYNEIALREIAAIHRSDLTLMISEHEMEVLRAEFDIAEAQIAYWPFGLDLGEAKVP